MHNIYVHNCMCHCCYVYTCGGQRITLGINLYHEPSLKQIPSCWWLHTPGQVVNKHLSVLLYWSYPPVGVLELYTYCCIHHCVGPEHLNSVLMLASQVLAHGIISLFLPFNFCKKIHFLNNNILISILIIYHLYPMKQGFLNKN